MKTLLKAAGLLLLLAGAAVVIATGFGVLDPWIAEHWTCADGHGVRRECGIFEAKWSVLTLGGAAMLLGGVAALLASPVRTGSSAAFTLDLSRLRRR